MILTLDSISSISDDKELPKLKEILRDTFLWLCNQIEQKIIVAMREIFTEKESRDITFMNAQEDREKFEVLKGISKISK